MVENACGQRWPPRRRNRFQAPNTFLTVAARTDFLLATRAAKNLFAAEASPWSHWRAGAPLELQQAGHPLHSLPSMITQSTCTQRRIPPHRSPPWDHYVNLRHWQFLPPPLCRAPVGCSRRWLCPSMPSIARIKSAGPSGLQPSARVGDGPGRMGRDLLAQHSTSMDSQNERTGRLAYLCTGRRLCADAAAAAAAAAAGCSRCGRTD